MSVVLEVDELSAGYGQLRVVRELNLIVNEAEIVALLGPNGAGKSTTLATISGLLPILSGRIAVLGFDVAKCRRPERLARNGLAHVPEGRALFNGLSVRENLRLADKRRRRRSSAVTQALGYFPELEPLMD